MRRTLLVAHGLAVACGLAISTAPHAQQRVVEPVVTRLSDAITYSKLAQSSPPKPALTTYVGFLVSITNNGTNTLNNVSFNGASVMGPGRSAEFALSDGSPCVAGATATQAVCTVGQLRSGSTAEFAVFFKAPLAPNPLTAEQVSFSGTAFYAEGTNDSPTSPINSSTLSNTTAVALGTNNPLRVRTGVRQLGGGLFTGDGAPTADNPAATFASLLQVPTLPGTNTFGFAELCESRPASPNPECATPPASPAATVCPTNVACLDFVDVAVRDKEFGTKLLFTPTTVTNPLAQYLVITLRRDSSVFKGSINNATVWYFLEGTPTSPNGLWAQVPACNKTAANPLATIDRCIWDRGIYKNNDPEARADPALVGDAWIQIIAKENGRLSW